MQSAKIDGSSFTTSHVFPVRRSGGFAPRIEHNFFSTGNIDGIALGTPRYREISFTMDILVKGDSISDFVQRRDDLIKLFRLPVNRSTKYRELEIIDDAGRTKKLNVVTQAMESEETPNMKDHGIVTVGFVGDLDYWRGIDKTVSVYIAEGGGMAVPTPIPMSMANNSDATSYELVNEGNTESYPTVRVHGDMNGFSLLNESTGETLTCNNNLLAGEYIDFDFKAQTATKGSAKTNVLNNVTAANWWALQPGSNIVSISTTSTSSVARADFTYQDAHLGL